MPGWKKALASATVAVFLILAFTAWKKPAQGPTVTGDAAAPADTVALAAPALMIHGYHQKALSWLLLQKQLTSAVSSAKVKRRLSDYAMQQLVSGQLLYQAASKARTPDLERQARQLVALKSGEYGSEADFKRALKEAGLDLPALREMIRRDLLIERFIEQKFGPGAACSEAEARRFYEENRNRFKTGPSVRASHILVAVSPRADSKERRLAREKAQRLLARVREGENFGVIAEQYSNCPSRVRGGDAGFIGHEEMDPSFESAAAALRLGGISDVVETPAGFHIIKVTEKRGARLEEYRSVRERVMQELKREKIEKMLADYLADLKSKARSAE